MSHWHVLAARLHHELQSLEQVVKRGINQQEKARRSGDEDYYQAVALSLQNFYMGIERIFEEIAKQVDESLPSGASSHRELLEQMSLEIPHTRPPVVSHELLKMLNEFRAFRHVVIHRYGFELHPNLIDQLVGKLPDCHNLLVNEVNCFCDFLLTIGKELNDE